jgi:alpha-tubulin suppressor-like RCC1 family protein
MISRLYLATAVLGLFACSSNNPPGSGVRPGEDASTDGGDGSSAAPDGGDAAAAPEGSALEAATAVTATAVAVGANHACALTSAGAVLCWGDNRDGQLGDGTTTQRDTPVPVTGLANPIRAIAAGDEHTCALDSTGAVLCWGSNASGALGDGASGAPGDGSTAAQRSTPGPVSGLTGVSAIAAGGTSTCAALASGSIVCWGGNQFGQLGDGSMMDRTAPSATKGVLGAALAGASSLAPSGDHTCVIATGGSVECAGDDTNGALGNDGNLSVDTYVSSGVTSDAVAVTSSLGISCALIDDGTVQCWGFDGDGELGNDDASDPSNTPVMVAGLAGVTSVAAGFHHVCAVTSAGMSCWGALGDGDDGGTMDQPNPVAITGLPGAIAAVAAGGNTCALSTAGAVLCWGDNTYGELGNGSTTASPTPVAVVGFP